MMMFISSAALNAFLLLLIQTQTVQGQPTWNTSQQISAYYYQDCVAVKRIYSALGGFYSFQGNNCCDWNFVNCGASDTGLTFRTPSTVLRHYTGLASCYFNYNAPKITGLTLTPSTKDMLQYYGVGCSYTGRNVPQSSGTAVVNSATFTYSCSSTVCTFTAQPRNRITSIVWRQQGLAGVLAPVMESLASDPTLNGALYYLQIFSLSGNLLRGPLPSQMSQLTSLQGLELDGNTFTGPIPITISSLLNLTRLTLSNNQLSGNIPSEIASLPALMSIELRNNFFTGTVPPQIYNMATLTGLILDYNRLTGSILPATFNLPSLTQLTLSYNAFSGPIPAQISNIPKLAILSLAGNLLSGAIPPQMGLLSQLQYLSLNENQLDGTVPTEIGNLSSLLSLFLNKNSFTGDLPTSIGNLAKLQFLRVENNQFSTIPISINNLNTISTVVLPNDNGTTIPSILALKNPMFTLSALNWDTILGSPSLRKRQQLSSVMGLTPQQLYDLCPLNQVTNPNVPAGCIAGIYLKFCANLAPTNAAGYADCRKAYDTVLSQSIFAPIGQVCPAWKNGPRSVQCARAISEFKVNLGYITVTSGNAQDLVTNIIGNPFYAPCVTIPGSVTCNWN